MLNTALYPTNVTNTMGTMVRVFIPFLGTWLNSVDELSSNEGELYFGDMKYYHIAQYSDGLIPLMGIRTVGPTDRDNALKEVTTYIIHGLVDGDLVYEDTECDAKTWAVMTGIPYWNNS